MKLSNILIFFFCALLVGCDNTIDFDNGPCKFAPPESKFEIFSSTWANCEDCFFNLLFMGKEYSFAGNQLKNLSGWPTQTVINAFIQFNVISPATAELLINSRGIKTPLLKLDTFPKLNTTVLPPLSASFVIYNYCRDYFEPLKDISQSFNQLTDAELVESYYVGSISGSIEQYQRHIFYCSGELQATFIINGETEVVTAQYKVKVEIWEEL